MNVTEKQQLKEKLIREAAIEIGVGFGMRYVGAVEKGKIEVLSQLARAKFSTLPPDFFPKRYSDETQKAQEKAQEAFSRLQNHLACERYNKLIMDLDEAQVDAEGCTNYEHYIWGFIAGYLFLNELREGRG